MTKIKRTAIVPFSAQQVYDLVNDVANYPQFLPWCANSEVLQQTDTEMLASLEVQKGNFRQRFTTCNELDIPVSIIMRLAKGPFSALRGEWHFMELNAHACRINFELDFAFNNQLIAMTLTPLFRQIANTIITAFAERAAEVYADESRNCLRTTT